MSSDKILLVDDDPTYLSAWSYLLSTSGYEVIQAKSGEEALTMVDHQIPDLAIVDIYLPGINGDELCRRLKTSESTSSILVMLVTGKIVSPEDQAAGLDAGADDFVLRPIENRHLLARVRSLFRVIHSRDVLERELSLALQRLKLHTENTPLGVIEFNDRYQIINWSKSAERIFGWNASEVLGKAITDFRWVVEDDQKSVAELGNDMSSGIRTSNLNINRNYRKDGTIITCEWHNSALMDANGKMISVLSLIQDITKQRDAERQLRESQSRLDLALTAANQGVWDYNLKTGVITGSNRWAEILGYPIDDVSSISNTKLNDLIHPEDAKLKDEELRRHLTKETEVYKVEMRFKQKNGDWIWVRSQGRVVEWDSLGNPVRIVGTIYDITKTKKQEIEQEHLLAELQEALAKIKTLSGLLPICSSCKKIRDDKGYWNTLEKYITEHSDAMFSHGMCPDCMKRDYPSAYKKMYEESQ